MFRLQPQLDPNRFDTVQFFQQIQHFLRQAVRPCGNGKDHDLRVRDRFHEHTAEPLDRRIGVGESLEICDVSTFSRRHFICHQPFALFDLLSDRQIRFRGKLSRSRAEDAAARIQRPIPVRTGTSAVQRDLIHFAPIAGFQLFSNRSHARYLISRATSAICTMRISGRPYRKYQCFVL